MSVMAMFDTLAYAKKLKSVGFTEDQAEIQAEALAEIIDEKLATKQDIQDLNKDMKEMEVALKRDIKEMEINLKRDMNECKTHMIIRLGAIQAAGIAIVAALVKLL